MTSAFCRYTASSQKCALESPHTRRRNPAPSTKTTNTHSQISCFLVPGSWFPVIIVRSRSPSRCQSVTVSAIKSRRCTAARVGCEKRELEAQNALPYWELHRFEAERWLTNYRRPGYQGGPRRNRTPTLQVSLLRGMCLTRLPAASD